MLSVAGADTLADLGSKPEVLEVHLSRSRQANQTKEF